MRVVEPLLSEAMIAEGLRVDNISCSITDGRRVLVFS